MDREGRQLIHLDVRFSTSMVPTILGRFDLESDTLAEVTRTQIIKKHSWVSVEVYGSPGKLRHVIQLCRKWGGVVRILDQDPLCA